MSSAYREKVLSFSPLLLTFATLFAMFRTRVSNKSGKENFLFLHLPFRPRRRVFSTPLNANSESLSTKVGRGKRTGLNSMCHLLVTSPPRCLGKTVKEDGRGEICTSETYFFGTVSRQRLGSLLRIFLPLVVPRRYSGRSVAIWPQCYPSPLPPPPPPRSAFPISFRNGGGSRRRRRMPPHWGRPLRLFGHTRERMRDDRNVIRRVFCT